MLISITTNIFLILIVPFREFFSRLVADHLDLTQWGARIDFLSTYAAEHADGTKIAKELESMLGCQVSGSRFR